MWIILFLDIVVLYTVAKKLIKVFEIGASFMIVILCFKVEIVSRVIEVFITFQIFGIIPTWLKFKNDF